jgi:hypothetical protein
MIRVLLLVIFLIWSTAYGEEMNYKSMASTIVNALKLHAGEHVLIRFDPTYFQQLVEPLRAEIRRAGAIDLGAMEYVKDVNSLAALTTQGHLQAFEQLLDAVDVYLWLPASAERDLYQAEEDALHNWLKKGGNHREIHFHWRSGSMLADGLPGEHSPELDEIYANALDIDYAKLSASQDRVISLLKTGQVHVTTPAGTDLTFRTGDRPFNKQNGDASAERMKTARVLVDREIELPAGVIRVAPLESTVQGIMIIPVARFRDKEVHDLKFEIKSGKITHMEAKEGLIGVETEFSEVGDVARHFREFGLGMNPKLVPEPDSKILPYYGYGAGVVRLSIGDNQELGGMVKGGFVRWFFFPDATVEVNNQQIVKDGTLQ